MASPAWKGREMESEGAQAEASPQGHPVVTAWLKAHYEENASTMQCYLRNLKKIVKTVSAARSYYSSSHRFPQTMPSVLASVGRARNQSKKPVNDGKMCAALGCDAVYSLGVWSYCLVLGDQDILVSQPWSHLLGCWWLQAYGTLWLPESSTSLEEGILKKLTLSGERMEQGSQLAGRKGFRHALVSYNSTNAALNGCLMHAFIKLETSSCVASTAGNSTQHDRPKKAQCLNS